jgi:hypothetical protein
MLSGKELEVAEGLVAYAKPATRSRLKHPIVPQKRRRKEVFTARLLEEVMRRNRSQPGL